jgi:hypothetical protein
MPDTYDLASRRYGMKLRSSTRSKTSWMYLPTELRLMILETIAHQKYPGWASLASVCREWQAVLEKANYRKLKIRSSRLEDFDSMVPTHKRELISHIWLDIEIPRYKSKCCSRRRSPPANNSLIVGGAIWKLFSILSSWKPANKLTLELNVICPSDSEHWFKNLYFSSDHVEEGDTMIPYTADYPYHDPRHGWIHGQQIVAPPRSAMLRIFRPIEGPFRGSLPRVEAVTCLVIRRQFRRCICPFRLSGLIIKLPCLEDILYEPWMSYERDRGMYLHMRQELRLLIVNFFLSCET